MEEIEVTIQSILPADEPQGRYRLKISPESTVEVLLRELCRQANAPLRPEYFLRSKGHDLLQRTDTLANSGVTDGAFLHWTSEGVDTNIPRKCNTFWFLAVISLIIGAVGIAAITVIRFKDAEPITDYAIVFDAGSTHTAMFIYKWKGSKLNGTAVAVQSGSKCTAEGSGIAEFANDPQAAGKSLQSCLDKGKKAIPKNKHSTTPIYLGATAGMRLLQESNATASEAILKSVRATFSKSPFQFRDKNQSVRIISGSEEGTFSWTTSNYIANAFKVHRPGVKGLVAPTIVPSIGAMDLGGASTQITFAPENGTVMPPGFSKRLQLFGHNYTVYTHSYLCYGVKEVTGRISAALVHEQGMNKTEIQHPCLPDGYNLTKTYQELFGSPCVSGYAGFTAFGSSITVDGTYDQNMNYTFIGESNTTECQAFMNKTLFNFTSCPYSKCSFNDVYQPSLSGPFYAFSSFYYISSFLNLTSSTNSTYQHSDLVDKINEICTKNWAQLQEIPASKQEKANLMWYCLQSTYINLLLYDGYKFSDEMWKGVSFVGKVSATEVGWTLGFVLNDSKDYPANYPEVLMYTLTYGLLMALFCLFIITSIGFAVQGMRARGSNASRYRRMSSYGAI